MPKGAGMSELVYSERIARVPVPQALKVRGCFYSRGRDGVLHASRESISFKPPFAWQRA